MKLSHYLIALLLLLVFLSISIGTSDFSWGKLFALDHETWLLFQESRLPRTISILLTASSMSMAGLLMQTITQISLLLQAQLERLKLPNWEWC